MAKTSFKDTRQQSAQLLRSLEGGKYSPVYLLMGDEPYHIDLISDYIAENVLPDEAKAFNQVILYGKDVDGAAVTNQARRYPVMSSHQVVIVRQAQNMSGIDNLIHYLASPSPSTILVLSYQGKSMDRRLAVFKKINEAGTVLESVAPRDYEVGGWITDTVGSRGIGIDPEAVQMIADHVGADLKKIVNELEKLFTRLPVDLKTITADHIEQNIGISKEYNNFELTKALSGRDIKQALMIADHFAANPKDNPLMVTIAVLFNHFQRIVTLNISRWEHKRENKPMASEQEIAKLLGLSHAFFVSEYLTASANYPNSKAFPILGLLREWDMKSKGMDSGSADQGQLLKELILRISMV